MGHVHGQVLTQGGLEVSLENVGGRKVVITGSGEEEGKANSGDLGDSGEDMSEIDASFPSNAVGDETAFELFDAHILLWGIDDSRPTEYLLPRKEVTNERGHKSAALVSGNHIHAG